MLFSFPVVPLNRVVCLAGVWLAVGCTGQVESGGGKPPSLNADTAPASGEPAPAIGPPGDVNNDGVLDALGTVLGGSASGGMDGGVEVDTDGDGVADGVGLDTDGDGLIDAVDGDGDGMADITTQTAPASIPGVFSSTVPSLPGGQPTACEWEWTVRTLHYNPGPTTPRRMYTAACGRGANARMFVSGAMGDNAPHPEDDPTSGYLVVADLDDESGTLKEVQQRGFEECISMHGVAVSDDCQTIGVLCRIPSGTQGFDKDVLATHPAADWMTNPYVCGDRGLNDEMWLLEWTDGNIQGEPKRYIVHKSIGSWEYGNNYLRLAHDGSTWGIGVKATVGGEGGSGCHEADALLVMDRASQTFTTRGWSWACGTGHTQANRFTEDPTTGKYAALCSTDYNEMKVGGLGAFYFRMEDGKAQEFHYLNLDGIKNKGAASSIVARTGGGFLGVIVGVPGEKTPEGYPDAPPTQLGLVRFSAEGQQEGAIRWFLSDPEHYLSYSTLSVLGPHRYLLGYGVMGKVGDSGDTMRVPGEFRLLEIDEYGRQLSDPLTVEGAGWGELDEMAPLGNARAGWAYIDNPAIGPGGEITACGQPSLELSVYTSPTP